MPGSQRSRPEAAASGPTPRPALARVALFALLGLVTLAYANSCSSEFVYDDRLTVVENDYIRSPGRLGRFFCEPFWAGSGRTIESNYRPLVLLTLALDHARSGLDPWGYHATNLLLHLAAVALAFRVATVLLPAPAGALLAAALFGLHPLQTEAVNCISCRGDLLVALFAFAALLLHRRALAPGAERSSGPSLRAGTLAGAWSGFALACFSKESGIAALSGFLAYDALYRSGGRLRDLGRALSGPLGVCYAGYAVIAALYLGVRSAVVGSFLGSGASFIDNPLAHQPWPSQKLLALGVAGHQARLLLWPQRLSVDYSYHALPLDEGLLAPDVLLGLGALALCVGLLVWGWRRARAVAFGVLFLAGTYSPTSNLLFPVEVMLSERFMTVPLFGFALAAAGLWQTAVRRARGRARAGLVALACLAVVACAGRTLLRNPDWRSTLTLMQATVEVVPNSAKAWFGLGHEYAKQQDAARAAAAFARAVAIAPFFPEALSDYALVLGRLGRHAEAIEAAQSATRLQPTDPLAWNNLGVALYRAGRLADATLALKSALALAPDFAQARKNLLIIEQELAARQ